MPLSLTPPDRAEFRDFPRYYDAAIAPMLASWERRRREALRLAAVPAAAGVAAGGWILVAQPFGEPKAQLAVLALIGPLAFAAWIVNRARADITHDLLKRVCAGLGLGYRRALERPPYYWAFEKMKLLPAFHHEQWEDEVEGERHGRRFTFVEARLQTGGRERRKRRTVFHGQLLVIDYPKRFLGATVVQRDRGPLNFTSRPAPDFQRVGLASPDFEKAFEAWGVDQVEARDLLDPLVLERFLALERAFDGGRLRAAFLNEKVFVALETGDHLGLGSMFTPLDRPARVEAVLSQIDAVFDLVDTLVKRIDGPLDGPVEVAHLRRPD